MRFMPILSIVLVGCAQADYEAPPIVSPVDLTPGDWTQNSPGSDSDPEPDPDEDTDVSVDSADTGEIGDTEPQPCATGHELHLDLPGSFFTVTDQAETDHYLIGAVGQGHEMLTIEVDMTTTAFRNDQPRPDGSTLWDHIYLHFSRENMSQGWEEYLGGAAARVEDARGPRSVNYARVEIAPGHEAYVSYKMNYTWEENSDYHIQYVIDVATQTQTLTITGPDGVPAVSVAPADPYLTSDLLAHRLRVQFGGHETDHREVAPYGWSFANACVYGDLAP